MVGDEVGEAVGFEVCAVTQVTDKPRITIPSKAAFIRIPRSLKLLLVAVSKAARKLPTRQDWASQEPSRAKHKDLRSQISDLKQTVPNSNLRSEIFDLRSPVTVIEEQSVRRLSLGQTLCRHYQLASA